MKKIYLMAMVAGWVIFFAVASNVGDRVPVVADADQDQTVGSEPVEGDIDIVIFV